MEKVAQGVAELITKQTARVTEQKAMLNKMYAETEEKAHADNKAKMKQLHEVEAEKRSQEALHQVTARNVR